MDTVVKLSRTTANAIPCSGAPTRLPLLVSPRLTTHRSNVGSRMQCAAVKRSSHGRKKALKLIRMAAPTSGRPMRHANPAMASACSGSVAALRDLVYPKY